MPKLGAGDVDFSDFFAPLALAFVVHGPEIGDVDVGYGPARGFSNADVRGIASALETIDATSLMADWDADAIRQQEIYMGSGYHLRRDVDRLCLCRLRRGRVLTSHRRMVARVA